MLAKKYRLTKDKDIQNVLKKGKLFFSPFFNLKILPNNLQNPRFCIVISTKISKKAVVRNKVKRQLRDIIHRNLSNISQNYDFVILAKPAVTITEFKELEKALTYLLEKAKII